jgi:hypothetical protein
VQTQKILPKIRQILQMINHSRVEWVAVGLQAEVWDKVGVWEWDDNVVSEMVGN